MLIFSMGGRVDQGRDWMLGEGGLTIRGRDYAQEW